jgi:hypothetical protein
VPTYSTLGHLPDPVFNAMLGWRDSRLVGTIFHELAHERLYVAGDSEFNEAFASVVEEAGLRRWLHAVGRDEELAKFEVGAEREAQFTQLLRETRRRLKQLYESELSDADQRVEKQREFGRLLFEYGRLRAAWDDYPGYDPFFQRPLNNAHLASVATYHDCVPGLRLELERAGSMQKFYERAEELAQLSSRERRRAVCRVIGDIPKLGLNGDIPDFRAGISGMRRGLALPTDRDVVRPGLENAAFAGVWTSPENKQECPQLTGIPECPSQVAGDGGAERRALNAEFAEAVVLTGRVERGRKVIVGRERLAGDEVHHGRLDA